jgi:hypothetical protein
VGRRVDLAELTGEVEQVPHRGCIANRIAATDAEADRE